MLLFFTVLCNVIVFSLMLVFTICLGSLPMSVMMWFDCQLNLLSSFCRELFSKDEAELLEEMKQLKGLLPPLSDLVRDAVRRHEDLIASYSVSKTTLKAHKGERRFNMCKFR